jgi:hypothetical protein
MKTDTYPLAVPTEMMQNLRKASGELGLSIADIMRQSIKLGFPILQQQLSVGQNLEQLKPLTEEQCRECWETPDPEFDALAAHLTSLPVPPPEE